MEWVENGEHYDKTQRFPDYIIEQMPEMTTISLSLISGHFSAFG